MRENRLYLRFIDQFMAWYFEILDTISHKGVPRNPQLINDEELLIISTGALNVSVLFEVMKKDFKQPLQVIIPLEVLIPDDQEEEDEDERKQQISQERVWSRKLAGLVENVSIPLHAELASGFIPLNEVSNFKAGQRFDVELNFNSLKVLDDSGSPTFSARVDLAQDKIQLCVTGTNKNNRN